MLQGKRIDIDATTLEANAAMKSIMRRDTGESYMVQDVSSRRRFRQTIKHGGVAGSYVFNWLVALILRGILSC